ncbi:hypothetical protein FRACYDRAFT_251536 [Fragilariopsis cylindrus CCMP1102]|uniref:Uncharacterized protein n=1 Tax=Fragilariopsis cylindrus CCMP1102 TaxID=635003 RepID=A0A1E7ENU8_9STRA|nr:hypothetical protein FRACYDRAFT_251536 [Fragilariopsis cylindrus CCMP1102]|eukprot:OEU07203.1 hypothetical protein FRACYDRAFT_251536 [Fragilariopsis cylindrus CCMP1102]
MNTLDDYLDDDEQQQREFNDNNGDYNPNGNNEYYDNNNNCNENENENEHQPPDERVVVHLNLRRLLYRMERYENFITIIEDDDNGDDNQNHQSWHSLLLRAQLCQDLWQQVAAYNVVDSDNTHDDDNERKIEYRELSIRVDTACRRARVIADQVKQQTQEGKGKIDLVESLFFSGDNEDGRSIDDEDDTNNNLPVTLEEEVEEDEDEEDEDSSSDDNNNTASSNTTNNNTRSHKNNIGLQAELQESQREQMEEAISIMACQMKEATKGIQSTIQKQTESTLDQLEDVAEQNMMDVSEVAQNVKQHHVTQSNSNWGSWTTIILLVGIFVFTFLTIFTIPKSSKFLYRTDGRASIPIRLLKKATDGIQSVLSLSSSSIMSKFRYNDDEHDDEDNDSSSSTTTTKTCKSDDYRCLVAAEMEKEDNNKDDWKQEEQQQKEKERLDEIVQNMKKKKEKQKRGDGDDGNDEGLQDKEEKEERVLDNPWGVDPEEEIEEEEEKVQVVDNPWGIEPEDVEVEVEILEQHYESQQKEEEEDHRRRQQQEEEDQQQKQQQVVVPPPSSPEDINVNDIFASLQRQQQAVAVANDIAASADDEEENTRSTTTSTTTTTTTTTDHDKIAPTMVKREGVASQQISPRDFRVAAASNDYDTLQEYLNLVPEHINRQDKFGWTALHLATRSGHENIVRLLLQSKYNGDVTILSNSEETAFDVANDKFSIDHPMTQIFIELGLYPDNYYEKDYDDDDDELKDVKEFVNEEIEAQKAKE